VSDEALMEHCRDRLARYKAPKRVVFVDALPMSAMNKVLKDELRALVEHEEVTA
jgi:fatty-acyl-CoA synthase